MPRTATNSSWDHKLKPAQKLCCASCELQFNDIISAAEHTIVCKVPMLRNRKKEKSYIEVPAKPLGAKPLSMFQNRSTTLKGTFMWKPRSIAKLLALVNDNHLGLGDVKQNKSMVWKVIEKSMRTEYHRINISDCQVHWLNLQLQVNLYDEKCKDKNSSNPEKQRPDFYYVIKEIQRRMGIIRENSLKRRGANNLEIADDEDALADPEIIEEDPFTGILDSQGTMHMRDFLFEIVEELENSKTTDDKTESEILAKLGTKYKVEPAIIHWVKENHSAVSQGSLNCSFCGKRILKRIKFCDHELKCALIHHPPVHISSKARSHNPNKRRKVSLGAHSIHWSSAANKKFLKYFSQNAQFFILPTLEIRVGLWVDLHKKLKHEVTGLTPRSCSIKWQNMVREARNYCQKRRDSETHKTPLTEQKPKFLKEISQIVDLFNTVEDSPESLIPKHVIPLDKKLVPCVPAIEFSDEEAESNPSESVEVILSNHSGNNSGYGSSYHNSSSETESCQMSDNYHSTNETSFIDKDVDDYESDDLDFSSSSSFHKTPTKKSYNFTPKLKSIRSLNSESSSFPGQSKQLEEVDRKMRVMISQLTQLEEDNRSLRSEVDSRNVNGDMCTKMEKITYTLRKNHQENIDLFKKIQVMFHKHHQENIALFKDLVNVMAGKQGEVTRTEPDDIL